MGTGALLGRGVYDLPEASRLLGLSESTLSSWARPSAAGLPAIAPPSHGWAYSFRDLVTLAMGAVLRQRGVSIAGIRRTHVYLQQREQVQQPFARQDIVHGLSTAFGSVITSDDGVDLTRDGQMVLLGLVEQYLLPLTYDEEQLARLWRPADHLLLDPGIQVGQPCVEGSRVTTTTVAGRYGQGENLRLICEDLDLTIQEARACVAFEDDLAKGKGLALAPAA